MDTQSKVTFREFRMWLDGLLDGNENRTSLPTLGQWQKMLAMLERVDRVEATPSLFVVPASVATISDGGGHLSGSSLGGLYQGAQSISPGNIGKASYHNT